MEKRNLLRSIPKKSVKIKEKEEEKTLNESEVFKTETKHDLDVLPINEEPTEMKEDKKEETTKPEKKKRQIRREMCGCGKDYAINAQHFHNNTKQHKEWLKSQKEKPEEDKKDVEVEKISVSVPQESETKKQETVKPKSQQPFEIDYDRIINGVSQNYINYKLQKQEHKKKQPRPVDDYKTKYEKLLEQQEKDKKKHQANLYLYKQNQAFGRPRRGGGWFN